jgi:hypothetical protein
LTDALHAAVTKCERQTAKAKELEAKLHALDKVPTTSAGWLGGAARLLSVA